MAVTPQKVRVVVRGAAGTQLRPLLALLSHACHHQTSLACPRFYRWH